MNFTAFLKKLFFISVMFFAVSAINAAPPEPPSDLPDEEPVLESGEKPMSAAEIIAEAEAMAAKYQITKPAADPDEEIIDISSDGTSPEDPEEGEDEEDEEGAENESDTSDASINSAVIKENDPEFSGNAPQSGADAPAAVPEETGDDSAAFEGPGEYVIEETEDPLDDSETVVIPETELPDDEPKETFPKTPSLEPVLITDLTTFDEEKRQNTTEKLVGKLALEEQILMRRRKKLNRWVLRTPDKKRIPLKSNLKLLQAVRDEKILEGYVAVTGVFVDSGFGANLQYFVAESISATEKPKKKKKSKEPKAAAIATDSADTAETVADTMQTEESAASASESADVSATASDTVQTSEDSDSPKLP